MASPTLTFKCEEKDGKLEVTIVSCKGLPDLDGASNLTDAYVFVKVGTKKERTKAVGGALDPTFDAKTSTFEFDVRFSLTEQFNSRLPNACHFSKELNMN